MVNHKLPPYGKIRFYQAAYKTQIITVCISIFLSLGLIYSPKNEAETSHLASGSVYIASPKDGDTVSRTFTVRFGLKGMGVAPAGVDKNNTGHHHLLIDGKALPDLQTPLGQEVKHFGGGQTETELTLPPGKHTLQLILGDKNHQPHQPPLVSHKITVTVE